MDAKNLADLYDLAPIPWSQAVEALDASSDAETRCFLATTRPDGRPHMAGVGALWDDGRVYVVSGPGTRKSQNLAANPRCAVAFVLPGWDIVVEGAARRVTDSPTLERLAARYAASGWPARVEDGAFTHDYSAPSAGPPPWYLYEIVPSTVFGVRSAAPGGAMRWRP